VTEQKGRDDSEVKRKDFPHPALSQSQRFALIIALLGRAGRGQKSRFKLDVMRGECISPMEQTSLLLVMAAFMGRATRWKNGSEGTDDMSEPIWRGVPLEKSEAWQEVFSAISESYDVPGACPVCGACTLKRYYFLNKFEHLESRGLVYKGKGSLWEWCSSCKVFSHAQAFVPESWNGLELKLDHGNLTPIPDVLDELIATMPSTR
jgi:hypothetical protein